MLELGGNNHDAVCIAVKAVRDRDQGQFRVRKLRECGREQVPGGGDHGQDREQLLRGPQPRGGGMLQCHPPPGLPWRKQTITWIVINWIVQISNLFFLLNR